MTVQQIVRSYRMRLACTLFGIAGLFAPHIVMASGVSEVQVIDDGQITAQVCNKKSVDTLTVQKKVVAKKAPIKKTKSKKGFFTRVQNAFRSPLEDRLRKRPTTGILQQYDHLRSGDLIIEGTEYEELQLGSVFVKLDRTKTSVGRWALYAMMAPITDVQELQRRQDMVKLLLEEKEFAQDIEQTLKKIASNESSLLDYYDPRDGLSSSATGLFYRVPKLKYPLNRSKIALELAMWAEMGKATMSLGRELFLGGIMNEISNCAYEGENSIDLWRGMKGGLMEPWHQVSLGKNCTDDTVRTGRFVNYWMRTGHTSKPDSDDYQRYVYGKQNALYEFQNGSWRDRYEVAKKFSDPIAINFFNLFTFNLGSSSAAPLEPSLFAKASAAFVATGPTLWFFIRRAMDVEQTITRLKFVFTTMNNLQTRLVQSAQVIADIQHIQSIFARSSDPRAQAFAKKLRIASDKKTIKKIKELRGLLQTGTFKNPASFFYIRGRVLRAHALLDELTTTFAPLVQAVGELDAYNSIAQLLRDSVNEDGSKLDNSFVFVDYVESDVPHINLKSCWIPILPVKKIVTNDIVIGADDVPAKVMITGPNGGGKSMYLKSLGHAVVLSQSWGIAPAQSASMSIIHGIRTCLHPREDLQRGMSTFMAEKERMDYIKDFIADAGEQRNVMALIDEPYRGTVDAESADRIYDFGRFVAEQVRSVVFIATHVYRPVALEKDTNGIFANRHVAIIANDDGTFERTFTITQGPATWWFNDRRKRSAFIDWLGTLIKKRR